MNGLCHCLMICHKLRCAVSINLKYDKRYTLQILRTFHGMCDKYNNGCAVS